MTKYDVTLRDAKTGIERKLETIIKWVDNYDADDYIRDCDRDYDGEWCEMIKKGEIIITPVYDEVLILMKDRCTRSEAERYLKNGAVVYDSIAEYIQELKNSGTYNGEMEDAIRSGDVEDVEAVTYAGHEYCVMYVH